MKAMYVTRYHRQIKSELLAKTQAALGFDFRERLNESVFCCLLVVAFALGALGDLVMRGIDIGVGADGAFPDIRLFSDELGQHHFFLKKYPLHYQKIVLHF